MLRMNTSSVYRADIASTDAANFTESAMARVERFLARRSDHRETQLRSLPSLAQKSGVSALYVKDESTRLSLGSFKALGGAYAVVDLVLGEAEKAMGRPVDFDEMDSDAVRKIAGTITVGCATDGNHGKSVAAGAQLIGANAVIFVHSGVTDERVNAIAACGASIVRVEGTYDDSVAESDRVCREKGWRLVSDTSWPGYETIPAVVMQGYTAMLRETMRALPEIPTHVFVQAGVGGLAAAVAGYFSVVYGSERPTLIVVEPDRAACLFESAVAGKAIKIKHGEPTIMAMLECYEPSMVAWRIIERTVDAFETIPEELAEQAMRTLANPLAGDPPIVAGESGAAGLAGFMAVLSEPGMAQQLDISARSRILLFNTEYATDRSRYAAIVGRNPEDVLGAGSARGAS